jgi:hypothetical protein
MRQGVESKADEHPHRAHSALAVPVEASTRLAQFNFAILGGMETNAHPRRAQSLDNRDRVLKNPASAPEFHQMHGI